MTNTALRERTGALRPSQVEELQKAIVKTEEALLLTPATPDPAVEQLREEACGLVVDLQQTLHRLRKRMEGGKAEPPESAASWLANASRSQPKPTVTAPARLVERRHSGILGRRVFVPA